MADDNAATPSDRSKLMLALLVIVLATALRFLDRIEGKEWVSVVSWVTALYMVGQVAAAVAQGWTVQAISKATSKSQAVQ